MDAPSRQRFTSSRALARGIARRALSRGRHAWRTRRRRAALHHVARLRRVRRLDAVFGAGPDQPRQRETAAAGVVLSGAGRPGPSAVQPTRRRRRDVCPGGEAGGRRARRRDRQGTVDVDGKGDRARHHLLGKQGSRGSSPDRDHEQRHPRDQRQERRVDQDIRPQRHGRHADRAPIADSEDRPRVRAVCSRTCSSWDRRPARDMARPRATCAPTTS